MKNKKLLTLGMAVVLTLSSTLTGCGKTEDADTAVEATEKHNRETRSGYRNRRKYNYIATWYDRGTFRRRKW